MTTCRRCSECDGMSHHWIPDPMDPSDPDYLPGDYACKHCEQRGDCCDECSEEGCESCNHEGVIPLTPAEHLAGLILARWERMEATAGQASQAAQDSDVGACLMLQYVVETIEEVYPAEVNQEPRA